MALARNLPNDRTEDTREVTARPVIQETDRTGISRLARTGDTQPEHREDVDDQYAVYIQEPASDDNRQDSDPEGARHRGEHCHQSAGVDETYRRRREDPLDIDKEPEGNA